MVKGLDLPPSRDMWLLVCLLICLAIDTCRGHAAPQIAGSHTVTLQGDDISVAKLRIYDSYGMAVSLRFDPDLLAICTSLSEIPEPATCERIEPYHRAQLGDTQHPKLHAVWWFTIQRQVAAPRVVNTTVSYYVDFMQQLEFGVPSVDFDLGPGIFENFAVPNAVLIRVDYLQNGGGFIESTVSVAAENFGGTGGCFEAPNGFPQNPPCFFSWTPSGGRFLVSSRVQTRSSDESAPLKNFTFDRSLEVTEISVLDWPLDTQLPLELIARNANPGNRSDNLTTTFLMGVIKIVKPLHGSNPFGLTCLLTLADATAIPCGDYRQSPIYFEAAKGDGSMFEEGSEFASFGSFDPSLDWYVLVGILPRNQRPLNALDIEGAYVIFSNYTNIVPAAPGQFVLPVNRSMLYHYRAEDFTGVFRLQFVPGVNWAKELPNIWSACHEPSCLHWNMFARNDPNVPWLLKCNETDVYFANTRNVLSDMETTLSVPEVLHVTSYPASVDILAGQVKFCVNSDFIVCLLLV
jgi:hypothetical protein